MQTPSLKKSLFWTVLSLFVLHLCVIGNTQSGRDNYKDILEVDAVGYYSFLPAFFEYKDPNFTFLDKIENPFISGATSLVRVPTERGNIDRYFIGTSILMAPFYLAATCFSDPQDGYGKYQLLSISIAASFYLYAAFFLIGLFLKNQFHLHQKTLIITIISFALGTNLFYYSIFEPGMSHIYSFFMVAVFLTCWQKLAVTQKYIYFLFAALALGLITIIRPVNLLIVLCLPLIWPKVLVHVIQDLFSKKIPFLVSGIMLFSATIFIQLLYYKLAIGAWFIYSYKEEGFDFTSPHITDVLFSYRKGLFVYMPMLFVALAGIYYWSRKQTFVYGRWLISFALIVFVLSSWSSWAYGGCFGNRAFIEYYMLFIIPFALLVEHTTSPKILYAVIAALILLCQIQTYQYRYAYIHWDEMNKEKYWKVFLRVDYLINKKPVHEIYK